VGEQVGASLTKKIVVALLAKNTLLHGGDPVEIDPQAPFSIDNLFADEYWLAVSNLPPGYYVQASTIGGSDAWTAPARVGQGELRIKVAADGARLSGQVISKGSPVPRAIVALALAPLPQQIAPNHVLTSVTDENGRFQIESIPPNTYQIGWFNNVELSVVADPNHLRSRLSTAEKFRFEPRDSKVLTLTADHAR
jgi:hypothetical protein